MSESRCYEARLLLHGQIGSIWRAGEGEGWEEGGNSHRLLGENVSVAALIACVLQ